MLFAAPPKFQELSDDEREELRRELRSIYVLGDPRNPRRSVLSEQAKRLESSWGSIEQIPRLFHWDSLIFDQSYAFDQLVSSQSGVLESLYLQLRPGNENLYTLLRKLRIEREEKDFRAGFPVFSDAQIFPSLNRSQIEFLYPGVSWNIEFPISFEEYLSLVEWRFSSQKSEWEVLQSYLKYLSLGNPSWTEKLPSQDSFQRALDSAVKEIGSLAEKREIPLDSVDSHHYLDQADFLFELLQYSHERQWSIREQRRWRWTMDDIDRVNALSWFEFHYSNRWSEVFRGLDIEALRVAVQNGLRPPDLDELFQRIRFELGTNANVRILDRENVLISLAQVKTGEWQHKDFPYFELSDQYRGIVSLMLFPQLSIEQGRALLEQRVFELDQETKAAILNTAFQDVASYQAWQDKLQGRDITRTEDRRIIHAELVEALLKSNESSLSSLELLRVKSGEVALGDRVVPTRSVALKRARSYLEEHPELWDDSLYPDWLMDRLYVHLFPYPSSLSDEWDKFWQSFHLTGPSRKLNDEWEEVYHDQDIKEEKRQVELAELSEELQSLLFDSSGRVREDYSSPSVYLAHFVAGSVPSPGQALGSASFGTGFFVVSRVAGFKIVTFYLLASGGIHLVTTWAYNEDTKKVEQWDLSKGVSPPPGRWLAEALLLFPKLLEVSFLDPSASRRLRALEDLGRLSSEFLLFGLGHRAGSRFLPFDRLSLIRRQHFANKRILKIHKSRTQGVEALKTARRELAENTRAIEAYGSRPSAQRRSLLRKRRDLLRQIGQLETGFGSRIGILGFIGQQTGRLALRVGDALLIFLPSKRSPIRRGGVRGFLRSTREYWSRGRHLGLPQLDELERSVRKAYAKHERKFVVDDLDIQDQYRAWRAASKDGAQRLQGLDESIRVYLQTAESLAARSSSELTRSAKKLQKQLERALDDAEISLQAIERQARQLEELPGFEAARAGAWEKRAHRLEGFLRRDPSVEEMLQLDLQVQRSHFASELWGESLRHSNYLRTQLTALRTQLESASCAFKQSSATRLLDLIKKASNEITKMEQAQARQLRKVQSERAALQQWESAYPILER